MVRKESSFQFSLRKKVMTAILSIVVGLIGVLLFAQIGSAAQVDDKPTPPAGVPQPTPRFVGVSPTIEQLLNSPPSIERYVAAHTLPDGLVAAAELEESTKTVSDDSVTPGNVFEYTITVVNSGEVDVPDDVTDDLPAEVTYASHECPPLITDTCAVDSGILTWSGTVPAGESAEISIVVTLNGDVEVGTMVTNTAQISSADEDIERSADVTVEDMSGSLLQFAPFTVYGVQYEPQPVTLTASRPNSGNKWSLTWTESANATGYEIHESQTPDFAEATPTLLGEQMSMDVSKNASPDNIYYYRVRSLVGQKIGPWSNVVTVVGGYRDDFDDDTTGWSMRRSTYREKVNGFYENGKYVMQVLDRWDWGISSPLMPAPEPPYAIDFEAKIVAPANLLSFGMVFGGDWNGQTCPPGISYDEWYTHTNCFNHFYNTNNIFFGPIKLLFERVDYLVWLPNEGGSPMKRGGDINVDRIKQYNGIDPEGWNHYRIEVRENSIEILAAKRGQVPVHQYEYTDTRWIGDPYFGFFASTDEYNNSTWRFEYLEVLPLDN